MNSLSHQHLTLTHEIPLVDLQRHEDIAPLLSYTVKANPEAALFKSLSGFALGSLLMGVMLNAAAFLIMNHMRHLWEARGEFIFRGTFLAGLTFVGTSLLLVALKAREDRSPVPLHSKHWLVSLLTGAFFALAVFGPGLVAERGLALNPISAITVWSAILIVPIAASFWLVTRRRTRDVFAQMIGA